MRSVLSAVVAVTLAAGAAQGWGSLVASYASPGSSPYGAGFINYGGVNYITLTTQSPNRVWRLYESTGSVYSSFAPPAVIINGCDSGVLGGTPTTWLVSMSPNYIYRCAYDTGSIYNTYSSPATYPFGLAYGEVGGTPYLFHSDLNYSLYRLNPTTGSVYASMFVNFQPRDLAYGGGYLWFASDGYLIRRTNTLGSTTASFSVASGGAQPVAVAYDPVGPYIWVGFDTPANRLNVYEINAVDILPASLGKVKAIYR